MSNDSPGTIAAAVMLSVIGVFGLIPQPLIVGALQDHLAFSSQQAGIVTAAEIFAGALSSILAAFWIRRVNWRTAALFAIGVVVAGNVLASFQTDYTALLVIRGLVGLFGQGTAFVVAISIISTTSETDRNFAYAIAAQVAFGVVAFPTMPFAIAQWQLAGIFLPLAVFALVALPMLRWVPAGFDDGAHAEADDQSASLALPVTALGALLVWCIGLGGIYAFEERIGVAAGLENAAVGGALGIAVAVGFLGAMAASVVADRWGRMPPVTIALLAQIGAILLLQGEMTWIRFVVIASVFHFFWNFTGPYLMGTVASADFTGRISVLMPAAQTGGFAIGTALAGSLMAGVSLQPANYVAAVGCMVALLIYLPTVLRISRTQAA